MAIFASCPLGSYLPVTIILPSLFFKILSSVPAIPNPWSTTTLALEPLFSIVPYTTLIPVIESVLVPPQTLTVPSLVYPDCVLSVFTQAELSSFNLSQRYNELAIFRPCPANKDFPFNVPISP